MLLPGRFSLRCPFYLSQPINSVSADTSTTDRQHKRFKGPVCKSIVFPMGSTTIRGKYAFCTHGKTWPIEGQECDRHEEDHTYVRSNVWQVEGSPENPPTCTEVVGSCGLLMSRHQAKGFQAIKPTVRGGAQEQALPASLSKHASPVPPRNSSAVSPSTIPRRPRSKNPWGLFALAARSAPLRPPPLPPPPPPPLARAGLCGFLLLKW